MGTKLDMKRREKCQRVDDQATRTWLQMARDFIFKLGKVTDSKAVEDVLGAQSLLPTQVRRDTYSSARVRS